MSALNMMLAFSVTLWAVASGFLNTYNTRLLLFAITEDDVIWGDILNVGIKIEASTVPESAQELLREMNKSFPDSGQKRPETASGGGGGGGEVVQSKNAKSSKRNEAKPRTAVTYNALHILVHIVSKHHKESDALEFGQAIVACAIRCQAISIILAMIDVIDDTPHKDINVSWYLFIQNSLILYLDQIAQFKETLKFDTAIYREWQKVIQYIDTINHETGSPMVGDTKPIKNLIKQYLNLSCDDESMKHRVHVLLDISKDSGNSTDNITVLQTKYDNALNKLFLGISNHIMQRTHWDLYINNANKIKQDAINKKQDKVIHTPIL